MLDVRQQSLEVPCDPAPGQTGGVLGEVAGGLEVFSALSYPLEEGVEQKHRLLTVPQVGVDLSEQSSVRDLHQPYAELHHPLTQGVEVF